MSGYGQQCPIAKAAEILDQRWMLLVVRELVAGSDRFNDIHRGVPRMSRTLLSRRLKQLVRAGVVERRDGGDGTVYRLTTAGEELLGVLEAMGEWGMRWLDSLADEDLDPAFLLWDMHRSVDANALPEGRTVLHVRFDDVPADVRDWWLVLTRGGGSPGGSGPLLSEVDVCDEDPGFGTDVTLRTPLRLLTRVWRGDLGWDDALRGGRLELRGPSWRRREVPSWFRLSHFADVPRPT